MSEDFFFKQVNEKKMQTVSMVGMLSFYSCRQSKYRHCFFSRLFSWFSFSSTLFCWHVILLILTQIFNFFFKPRCFIDSGKDVFILNKQIHIYIGSPHMRLLS